MKKKKKSAQSNEPFTKFKKDAKYLKDKKKNSPKKIVQVPIFSFLSYWKESPVKYRKVVIGLLAFTLFNSSDVFLLLNIVTFDGSNKNIFID